MKTMKTLHRSGVGIGPERTVRDAAELMEQAGVGALGVIDHERLVGIVTDRDLVRRALARGLPADTRIDAVMTTPVVTIDADAEDHEAFHVFGTHGLRRLAVVGDGGAFVGIVSLDDMLIRLTDQLADLTRPITAEALFAHRDPPVPVPATN
jgi:CBS domain-containing protein